MWAGRRSRCTSWEWTDSKICRSSRAGASPTCSPCSEPTPKVSRSTPEMTLMLPDDPRPFDADNHYYEPLDAFTRHLDPAWRSRAVDVAEIGGRVRYIVGGKVNRAVSNPTFD